VLHRIDDFGDSAQDDLDCAVQKTAAQGGFTLRNIIALPLPLLDAGAVDLHAA
jgi:hypothetical protein